jgi:hypothetical protein
VKDDDGVIESFLIMDSYDSCSLVASGWTSADVTVDADGNIASYTGPDGL